MKLLDTADLTAPKAPAQELSYAVYDITTQMEYLFTVRTADPQLLRTDTTEFVMDFFERGVAFVSNSLLPDVYRNVAFLPVRSNTNNYRFGTCFRGLDPAQVNSVVIWWINWFYLNRLSVETVDVYYQRRTYHQRFFTKPAPGTGQEWL